MNLVSSTTSTTSLEKKVLTSQIYSTETGKWHKVIPVRDIDQCVSRNKVYIVMDAPFSSGHGLDVMHNGQHVGRAELSSYASYIDHIDNYEPETHVGVGAALAELTCRLALKSKITTINFYALDGSPIFHFKMGARFTDHEEDNDHIKEILAERENDDYVMCGNMQIDLTKLSSGSESPRLMQTILQNEISGLNLQSYR